MTPDEREYAFRRAVRHVVGPVIFQPADHTTADGNTPARGKAKRRSRAKASRAARKRNRR